MSLEVPPKLNEILEKISEAAHASKGDILLKAIYLMDIAVKNQKCGNKLMIINEKTHQQMEITGIC